MKFKINRFATEVDSITIPLDVDVAVTGSDSLLTFLSQVETSTRKINSSSSNFKMLRQPVNSDSLTAFRKDFLKVKKEMSKPITFGEDALKERVQAGTLSPGKMDITGYKTIEQELQNIKTSFDDIFSRGMSATMVDYFNTTPLEKYNNMLEASKESIKEFWHIYEVDRPSPGLMEVNTEYEKFLNTLREAGPLVAGVNDLNVDGLVNGFKETYPVMKSITDQFGRYKTVVEQSDVVSNKFKEEIGQIVEKQKELNKVQNEGANTSSKFASRVKEIFNAFSHADKAGDKLKDLSKRLRSDVLIQVQALYHVLRRMFSFASSAFTAAGDYVESMNLYRMSVGQYADAGEKWAEKISDALYLDTSEIYQYTGQFYNLTRGLGATAEAADLMSRNLTQLTYDMSSYLNIDVETANNKLMSAMSGQTKAVTSVGIAVQSASLQELAYSLNIKKSVTEMTQAEKTYLRYIQIMRSTTQMQGDLGRTIITPTNAMRLLRTQFNLLSRAIGQVFTPVIMTVLPYIIAFTQILQEFAQTLASALGYKLSDFLAPASDVKALADGFGDLDESAKAAGKSINRTLAPFDELNVVEMQSKGKGSGADNSILKDLEQYLTGYDMLEFYNKNMKDQIEDIKEKLEDILPIVGLVGAAFGTWKIGSALIDFVKGLWTNKDNLQLKVGLTLMVTGALLIWKGQNDIDKNLALGLAEKLGGTVMLAGGTYMFTKSIMLTLAVTSVALLMQSSADKNKDRDWLSILESLGGTAAAVGATYMFTKEITVSLAIGGIILMQKAMSDYNGNNFWLPLVESLGAGLVMGGATFMLTKSITLTLIVTGVTLITEGIEAAIKDKFKDVYKVAEYLDISEDAQKTIDSLQAVIDKYNEVNQNARIEQSVVDSHKALYDELVNITDENGKVKQGYEDRATFITSVLKEAYGVETSVVDGVVQNYKKLTEEMDLLIAKKKLKIWLDAKEENYVTAVKQQTEVTAEYNKQLADEQNKWEALQKIAVKYEPISKRINELTKKGTDLTKEEKKELKELKKQKDKLHDSYWQAMGDWEESNTVLQQYEYNVDQNTKAITEYEDLMVANTSNDLNKINAAIEKASGLSNKTLAEQLEFTIANRDSMLRTFKDTNGEITASEEERANLQLNSLIDSLKKQTSKVNELTPELEAAWKTLGEKDAKKFNEAMSSLPDDVKKLFDKVDTKLTTTVNSDMEKTGEKLGKTLGDSVSNNMKVNGSTLQSTLSNAIQNIKLPSWVQNTPLFGDIAKKFGFQFKADGGFLKTGEMFVAREAGPELVGKIGNRTAVANNDQITSAMTNAMIVALNGANTSKQPINNTVYIGSKKVFEGMGDYVDSENDRYGTNYIRV